MVAIASGLDTVIVRVVRARTHLDGGIPLRAARDDVGARSYVGLVYGPPGGLPFPARATPPPEEAADWAGVPLAGAETFAIDWRHYGAYLASFVEGGKQAAMMQERLFEAIPASLSAVLEGQFGGARPSRTWFHSDAPELAELPWELLAHRSGRRASTAASFVRGLPPEIATPLVPITSALRLGLIDPARRAPQALLSALGALPPGIEVRHLQGGARQAVQQAIAEGLELLHVVADGSITSALEGLLEFPGAEDPPLPASELAGSLRGSRVRLLGLTPCLAGDPASIEIGRWTVPAAHRAFTYFATSIHPLPTMVVPLGPIEDGALEALWRTFYSALAESLEIEASMARVQEGGAQPVALVLRQLQVRTFRPVSASELPAAEPSAVSADLVASREALEQIQALKHRLKLKTASLDAYTERESARQSVLEAEVSGWVEGVDDV